MSQIKELRINFRIRTAFVRVIGKDSEQLGILDTRKAVDLAQSMGLDLVEVAPQADPPVCKIMDYGKYKYEEKKKAQNAKKKQVTVEIKEVQLRPKTEDHDLTHKAKSAAGFLEEGDKAKVTVFFRGREMEHLDMGYQTLLAFAAKLNDVAVLEVPPKMEGRRMGCVFGPLPKGKKQAPGGLVASFPTPHFLKKRSPAFGAPSGGSPSGEAPPTA